MLQLGSSKPWPDAMEVLSGQREMDASGLLEYFKPLAEWLEKNNRQFGEYVGWERSQKRKYYLLTYKGRWFLGASLRIISAITTPPSRRVLL
jgi:hypothetical protein